MKRNAALALASALALSLALPVFAGTIPHEDRLEMAAVTQAPITPNHAVEIAESGGGTAYGYGMESTRNGHSWYVVDVLRGGSKLAVRIDPSDGKILGSSPATGEGADGSNSLEGSKLTFKEAIAKAEQAGHGRALEANAVGHGHDAHVNVDVIQNHGKRIAHYRVSMHDGRIGTTVMGTDS